MWQWSHYHTFFPGLSTLLLCLNSKHYRNHKLLSASFKHIPAARMTDISLVRRVLHFPDIMLQHEHSSIIWLCDRMICQLGTCEVPLESRGSWNPDKPKRETSVLQNKCHMQHGIWKSGEISGTFSVPSTQTLRLHPGWQGSHAQLLTEIHSRRGNNPSHIPMSVTVLELYFLWFPSPAPHKKFVPHLKKKKKVLLLHNCFGQKLCPSSCGLPWPSSIVSFVC